MPKYSTSTLLNTFRSLLASQRQQRALTPLPPAQVQPVLASVAKPCAEFKEVRPSAPSPTPELKAISVQTQTIAYPGVSAYVISDKPIVTSEDFRQLACDVVTGVGDYYALVNGDDDVIELYNSLKADSLLRNNFDVASESKGVEADIESGLSSIINSSNASNSDSREDSHYFVPVDEDAETDSATPTSDVSKPVQQPRDIIELAPEISLDETEVEYAFQYNSKTPDDSDELSADSHDDIPEAQTTGTQGSSGTNYNYDSEVIDINSHVRVKSRRCAIFDANRSTSTCSTVSIGPSPTSTNNSVTSSSPFSVFELMTAPQEEQLQLQALVQERESSRGFSHAQ